MQALKLSQRMEPPKPFWSFDVCSLIILSWPERYLHFPVMQKPHQMLFVARTTHELTPILWSSMHVMIWFTDSAL